MSPNPRILPGMLGLVATLVWPLTALPQQPTQAPWLKPFDCVINPSVVADLGSSSPGILQAISVDRSDFISAGDVVAELESGVEQASLELARERAELTTEIKLRRVNAAFGERQYKRSEDLFQRKVISNNDRDERATEARLAKIQLQQAIDNRQIAQLELARATEILKQRTIVSPITGVVMERFKAIGEYVEDQPVVRVAQLDPLHVEVIVPVEHLGEIDEGMRGRVWVDALDGDEWQATVTRVDRVADVASGTYGVRLTLPNSDYRIPAGMRCNMQFAKAEQGENSPAAVDHMPDPQPVVRSVRDEDIDSRPSESPITDAVPTTAAAVAQPDDAESAVEPVPAAVQTGAPPTPAVPELSAAAPTLESPVLVDNLCRRLGPIKDRARAVELTVELRNAGYEVSVEKRAEEVNKGFRVVSKPLRSMAQAKAQAEALRAAGIEDQYLPEHKPLPVRISLGLYRSKRTADSRVRQLAAKGFEADVVAWTKAEPHFYLAINGNADNDARLAELIESDASLTLTDGDCQLLANE